MTLVTESVAASGDDIYASGSTYFATNEQWLWFGNWVTHGDDYNWIRFQTVAIPQGATIVDAKCRFYYTNDWLSTALTVRIYGNDVDDAANPANYTALAAKTKTTAYADWVIPASGLSGYVDTVDITAVVQEIVNRGGWASGNDMAFIFDCAGATSDEEVEFYAQDNGSNVPQLVINYTAVNDEVGSDSATLTDSTVLDKDEPATDSATLTDAAALQVDETASDSATLSESAVVEQGGNGSDSATLSESAVVDKQHVGSDSATLTDAGLLDKDELGSDSATLTDGSSLETLENKTGSDSAVLSEATVLVTNQALEASDSAVLSENASRLYSGVVATITVGTVSRFYRMVRSGSPSLYLHPVGRRVTAGSRSNEGYEQVSDRFVHNSGEEKEVMAAMSAIWAANKDAATATLKAAINQALMDLGYRGPGGGNLG